MRLLSDKLTTKEIIAYVSAILAILFGAWLLWFPPAAIPEPGNVGVAFAFITGGFAGLGVTVTVPNVYRAGLLTGNAYGIAGQTFSGVVGGMNGGSHGTNGHGYVIAKLKGGLTDQQAKDTMRAIRQSTTEVKRVSLMEKDQSPHAGGFHKGERLLVHVETVHGHGSQQAHDRVMAVADIVNEHANVQKGLGQNWCCYWDD